MTIRVYATDGKEPRLVEVGSCTVRVWMSAEGETLVGAADVSCALGHLPEDYRQQVPAEHRGLIDVANRQCVAVLIIPGVERYAARCRRGARAAKLLDAMYRALDGAIARLDPPKQAGDQRRCIDCRRRGLPRFCEPCRASRRKSRFKRDAPNGGD